MQLIKPDINVNFVGWRNKAFLLSGTIILVGLITLFARGGLRMGVDFAGGMLVQVKFDKPTDSAHIRQALHGIVANAFVQQIGSEKDHEYLIRTDTVHEELKSLSVEIANALTKAYGPGQQVLRVEMVGPKVGHDLRQKALQAIFYAFLFIALYISWRFEPKVSSGLTMLAIVGIGIYALNGLDLNAEYMIGGALIVTLALCWFLRLPYALGALLSLVHDILITVGIFALFNKEFTLEVFAALLTLSGYSLNDTIIVYDRIRENRNKDKKQSFGEMINAAINQTLSRTVLTSATVFFVILMLFLLGGTVIHDFCFAMLIGVITGSYSSVFVASPILIAYEDLRKKKSPGAKRAEIASGGARNAGAGREVKIIKEREGKQVQPAVAPEAQIPAEPANGAADRAETIDAPAVNGAAEERKPEAKPPARKPKKQKKQSPRLAGARKSGA
ncbi:MAG: protein translocase subunit SecF [Syntrophobacteraceae bacterium]|nr:protein translocase subunit SecF [Syntrophobacteraceae bacterium]